MVNWIFGLIEKQANKKSAISRALDLSKLC